MKCTLWITLATLVTPVLPGIILLGAINPLVLAFQQDIVVINRTGRRLRVSLVGMYEWGRHEVPPLFACAIPAIPAVRVGELSFFPDCSRRFVFDRDHITFIEIIVGDEHGAYRQCTVPRFQDRCVLDSWETLPPASEEATAAIPNAQRRSQVIWILAFIGSLVDVAVGLWLSF
jgi:hypothetical protein